MHLLVLILDDSDRRYTWDELKRDHGLDDEAFLRSACAEFKHKSKHVCIQLGTQPGVLYQIFPMTATGKLASNARYTLDLSDFASPKSGKIWKKFTTENETTTKPKSSRKRRKEGRYQILCPKYPLLPPPPKYLPKISKSIRVIPLVVCSESNDTEEQDDGVFLFTLQLLYSMFIDLVVVVQVPIKREVCSFYCVYSFFIACLLIM